VLHFVDSQTSVIFEKPIVKASLAVMTKVAMMRERPLTRSALLKVHNLFKVPQREIFC